MSNSLTCTTTTPAKLYLFSGNCAEATLKTSEDISGVNTNATGISYDQDGNTPWGGLASGDDKNYLQSGQFTSTIKTSRQPTQETTGPWGTGVNSNQDTPWTNAGAKMFISSGQFEDTVKDSLDPGAASHVCFVEDAVDGNSPSIERTNEKLVLFSGHITSTIKTSFSIAALETLGSGIGVDESKNTPYVGTASDKARLASGQFEATLKDSVSWAAITTPQGMENDGLPDVYAASNAFWSGNRPSSLAGAFLL